GVEMHLAWEVADFVDFYSSQHHAENVGRMFRPDAEPLLPNWRHLPVGYHGRSGTIFVDGTPVHRPRGQRRGPDGEIVFRPSLPPTNVARMSRPAAGPRLPTRRHLPVGYHGRSGTIFVDGTPVHRPRGQRRGPDGEIVFGPSVRLDMEAELGWVLGGATRSGET